MALIPPDTTSAVAPTNGAARNPPRSTSHGDYLGPGRRGRATEADVIGVALPISPAYGPGTIIRGRRGGDSLRGIGGRLSLWQVEGDDGPGPDRSPVPGR